MIRGNHDKVVCGLDSGDLFNPVALKAARWTTDKLTPRNRKFLETLPLGPVTWTAPSRSATARRATRTPTSSRTTTPT